MTGSRNEIAPLVPIAELPELFHRSLRTIQRWVAEGTLPSVRVGGSRYVRRADIDALLAPARRMEAELDDLRAAGKPVFTPEQLALVTRVLNDALASLRANDAA